MNGSGNRSSSNKRSTSYNQNGSHNQNTSNNRNAPRNRSERTLIEREVSRLKGASESELTALGASLTEKRINWYREHYRDFTFLSDDILLSAYRLLLFRFGISEEGAPIWRKTDRILVFHSKNFCPTLEACRILGLDTGKICRLYNEKATDALIKLIDQRLEFSRNYQKIRPCCRYCEEMITLGG